MSATMAGTTASYLPGPWVGLAGGRMWLVADLDPADPVVPACAALVARTATVHEVQTALLGATLRTPLNFAVLRVDDTGAEVVVRGEAWAEISKESAVDDDAHELRAGRGAFSETQLDRFGAVRLCLPAGSDPGAGSELPWDGSVVSALQVAIHANYVDSPAVNRPQPAPATDATAASGGYDAMLGHTVHPQEDRTQAALLPETWTAGMRPSGGGHVSGATLPPPQTTPGVLAAGEPRGRFESEPSAVREDGTMNLDWAKLVPDAPSAGSTAAQDYLRNNPPPTSYQPPPSFLIQGPPDAPTSYAPAPPPPYGGVGPAGYGLVQPGAGEMDPELMKTTQRAPSTPAATGPVVFAVRCVRGHPNPPAATRCRACGQGVPPQTAFPMPRPPLGLLRMSMGDVVPLDRGVILGRAPGGPEGVGPEEPYRFQVRSPDGSISRKHLEVLLVGWLVVVVDLQSTNGTMVTPAGGVPELLPPGGRRPIENGWTVHLDATTFFHFEVTE